MRVVKLMLAIVLAGSVLAELPRARVLPDRVEVMPVLRRATKMTLGPTGVIWAPIEAAAKPAVLDAETRPLAEQTLDQVAANEFEAFNARVVFRGPEDAGEFVPMVGSYAGAALERVELAPMVAVAGLKEAVFRAYIPHPSVRALPEAWDLVPFSLWPGSPAARLRAAANAEENRERVLALRAEYWATVNAAVSRREFFERVEKEEAERVRRHD